MPNWREVQEEIRQQAKDNPNILDEVRNKYLKQVSSHTGRNVIAYYSGWLQKPQNPNSIVNDKDKSAFMVNIHKMDRSIGLDLILHTPGGDLAATESIVDYLYSMFGNNIRAIVPQISMSAGTLIAFSCKEIIMGKQSNLERVWKFSFISHLSLSRFIWQLAHKIQFSELSTVRS